MASKSVSRAAGIDVRFERRPAPSAAWVRRVVRRALADEKAARTGVSVLITGNRGIRRINKRYLKHDYATDVISFGVPASRVSGQYGHLGDVVVSSEMAASMSKKLGLPYREELARYLVHGVLHLLGYDDKKTADRLRMHRRQEEILRKALKRA